MHTLSKPSPNSWIAVVLGIVLVLSPLFRFSWDIAPQTVLHLLLIPSLLILFALRVLPWTGIDNILLVFFAVCSFSIIGAPEKASVRSELLVLFDGLIVAYLTGFLSNEQKRKLLLIPLLAGLWFSVVLLFTFLKNPLHYFPGPDISVDFLVNANVVGGAIWCFAFRSASCSGTRIQKKRYIIVY